MVIKVLDNTTIYDKNGWEVDDSKNKESLRHANLPSQAPGEKIAIFAVYKLEDFKKSLIRYNNL